MTATSFAAAIWRVTGQEVFTRPPKRAYGAPRGYRAGVARRIDVGHLVGARQAAERLGLVRVQALHHFRRIDPTFPDALYWTAQGRGGTGVWYWPDIWRWAKASGRVEFERDRLPPLRRSSSLPVRRIDVADLIDGKRISQRLGLRGPKSFHLFVTDDPTFPDAVFCSTGAPWGTRLWAWPDVHRWARLKGRPVYPD